MGTKRTIDNSLSSVSPPGEVNASAGIYSLRPYGSGASESISPLLESIQNWIATLIRVVFLTCNNVSEIDNYYPLPAASHLRSTIDRNLQNRVVL